MAYAKSPPQVDDALDVDCGANIVGVEKLSDVSAPMVDTTCNDTYDNVRDTLQNDVEHKATNMVEKTPHPKRMMLLMLIVGQI